MISYIESTPILAFAILISLMYIGDLISYKTKAYVSALLVFVVLLLIGVWSGIFPTNIIEIPGFTAGFANYIILMFLVDMGSAISLKQFSEQWKTVIVSICTLLGAAAIVFIAGKALYDTDTALIAAPTVAGGFVSALYMSQAAINAGKEHLASLPALILLLHSFPAFFAFPYSVKKECNGLLKDYREGKIKNTEVASINNEMKKATFVDKIPQSLKTSAFYLASLAILAVAALLTSKALNNLLAPTVFGLLYGMLGRHFGILEEGSMKKSNSSGYLMFGSLISVFTSLATTNPENILAAIGTLIVLILLGLLGIAIGSIFVGKILGYSVPFSLAIGLNSLIGFPMNYMLTTEAITAIAKDDAEREYLTNQVMPSMLVAGFVCITIGSTILASIFANYL